MKLVEIDKLLLQLDRQLSDLPQRPKLADLGAAYEELAEKAEQTAKLRLRQEMRVKALEEEASMLAVRIADNQEHIDANSSRYKEVSLLAAEIEEFTKRAEKASFDAGEQRSAIARIDDIQAQIDSRITLISDKQRELSDSLENDINRLEEQVGKLKLQRGKLVSLLPEGLVARYDRQRILKKGIGATALEGRICGACRIELTEGQIVLIKREADSAGIGICPTCHRLLVL